MRSCPPQDDCDQTEPLGYYPNQGGQDATPKKIPETDAIFAEVAVNQAADAAPRDYGSRWMPKRPSRLGPSRAGQEPGAAPQPTTTFSPRRNGDPGRALPAGCDELFLYEVTSKVTSDCLVDG